MLKFQYSTLGALAALGLAFAAGGPAAPARLAALNHVRAEPGVVAALRAQGFNALGGDSDPDLWRRGLPRLQLLQLSRHLQADLQTPAVDVYAPGFAAELESLVRIACAPQRQDPLLIGYLSDDGLDWDPATHPEVVLRYYLGPEVAAAGRRRALDFLEQRYHSDIGELDRAWGIHARDFLDTGAPAAATPAFVADARALAEQVLARYLQMAADAIHASDANHPYFGAGLGFDPSHPDPGVWSIPDVASVAGPAGSDPAATATALRAATSKPLLFEPQGCAPPAAAWAAVLAAPQVRGYLWSPDGDVRQGACAAAAAAWGRINSRGSRRLSRGQSRRESRGTE